MAFAVPAPQASDRRLNHRYPIHVPLQYKLLWRGKVVKTGDGQTVNLSSSGAMIDCGVAFPKGVQLELSIAWPAKIDGKVGLTLVAFGKTVRTTGTSVAVTYSHHSFRTRSLKASVSSTGS